MKFPQKVKMINLNSLVAAKSLKVTLSYKKFSSSKMNKSKNPKNKKLLPLLKNNTSKRRESQNFSKILMQFLTKLINFKMTWMKLTEMLIS
jgi:hypothetical protein